MLRVFESLMDRVESVDWWLHTRSSGRRGRRGYRRVLAEHTYDYRFAEILRSGRLQWASRREERGSE